ncbi:hypothetical protein GH714_035106 [Hevea brasiliensis]|uniref:Uncharacterized protein n=1 Tax=Hevea brasiliensis TaxID=3981 RepID=A0A6A6M829_HEVBR|nr:hypothetical protein GH714_035106 [Hevea brasiliensis]
MVKFALKITAKLENATDLQPAGGADNGLPYLFKLQCTTCQAVSDKHICLSTSDPSSTTYKVVDGKYHEFQFTDGKFKKEEDQIEMIISNLEATFVVDRT